MQFGGEENERFSQCSKICKMESGDLGEDHSEDLMRPPHTLRSKRKRGSLKGEAANDNPPKKFCNEEAMMKVTSDVITLAEASFIDELKKRSDLVDSEGLKTSTPNGAENLPRRRKKRSLTSGLDTSVSMSRGQLDVLSASENSQVEETSGDGNSLELSSITDDSKPLERSGRRNKCTSARVLLGLGKRKTKEATEQQPKDAKETPAEVMGVVRKPKITEPKIKKEVLPRVKQEVQSSDLEGLDSTPTSLSVEQCSAVKPDWLKPFKLGWRREIVFRNTGQNPSSSKPLCDVYYFSAEDTKLRSLPQIIEYLKTTKSTLTSDCFTFTKCSIYKEPQELVRTAAFSRGRKTRKTGLLSSNESSMKSFDDATEDASSQASSTGTKRQRKLVEKFTNDYSHKTNISVKTEAPVLPVVTETPIHPVKSNVKKEEPSPEAGGLTSVDETDKRQAVRAAATLALRTYMNHALRTVNNPLLQSGNLKPSEKDKLVSSKSLAKTKSAEYKIQSKHRPSSKSLSPVVSLKRLNSKKPTDECSSTQPEEKVKRPKGPPSAVNLARLNLKRSDESRSTSKSQEVPPSKATKTKIKSLLSAAAAAIPGLGEKSIRDLKKMSPLKTSTPRLSVSADSPSLAPTSFEKINAAIKELMLKKDDQTSQKKHSKSHQQPAKALSKSRTMPSPAGKVLTKSDVKSSEKPPVTTERKPASAPTSVMPKPVESCLTETSRICGMDCPGRLGIPPTLPCATCMCLFHPECAGYTSHMYFTPQMNFTCWACGKLNKELESTSYGLYKRDLPELEVPSESSSKNIKKQSAVGKSASDEGISEGKMDAAAPSSPRGQQAPGSGSDGATAAAGLGLPNVLDSDILLSTMSVGETMDSSGPSAQLLVVPATLARCLNTSHPLVLLVDDKEVHVKPEQLKVSGMGLNIVLPMGSVPDAFVEGPEKPLEFRVVSSAESGRQAVAVCVFERPQRSSSAVEAFSTRTADPIIVSQSVGQSDSGVTISTESNKMTSDSGVGSIKFDTVESSLDLISGQAIDSISGQATGHAEHDGSPLTSDETERVAVTSAALQGEVPAVAEGECKAVDTTEIVDVKEDLDFSKSESKTEVSGEMNCEQMIETEAENIALEEALSVTTASNESRTEAKLSLSEAGKEEIMETSVEEPRADVSMEIECSVPVAGMISVDSINKTTTSGDRLEGTDDAEKTAFTASAVDSLTADEGNKKIVKETEIELVSGNSSETKSEKSQDRQRRTDTIEGNQVEMTGR